MARYDDGTEQHSTKTRKQHEDQRRMAFRRAIESYSDDRRLSQEISDYPEFNVWQAAPADVLQNARPVG